MGDDITSQQSDNWRDRGGEKHKAELEAVKRKTEIELASAAWRVASRVNYTKEIIKVGQDGLIELNDRAENITRLRPHLAPKLEELEDTLLQVIRWNAADYGLGK
jgi:hypothetical protein